MGIGGIGLKLVVEEECCAKEICPKLCAVCRWSVEKWSKKKVAKSQPAGQDKPGRSTCRVGLAWVHDVGAENETCEVDDLRE
jgi:hypothetical protein